VDGPDTCTEDEPRERGTCGDVSSGIRKMQHRTRKRRKTSRNPSTIQASGSLEDERMLGEGQGFSG